MTAETTEIAQPFDLDAAVQRYREAKVTEQLHQQERRNAESQQRAIQERDQFTAWLLADLRPDVAAALCPIVVMESFPNLPYAQIFLPDMTLRVSAYEHAYGRKWTVRHADSHVYWEADGTELDHAIVCTVGDVRDIRAKEEADAAEQARAAIERATRVAAAKAALWRWPEGRELVIYQCHWCQGTNGDGEFDYETVWTLQNELRDGRRLEPINGERVRYLDMQAHKPVFLEYVLTSMDDVPNTLKRAAYTKQGDNVGYELVAWLKALIEG